MARTFKRKPDEDDDDNFETTADGRRILKDGGRARVSLMDSDPLQRSVALNLHDGRGNIPGHRPGFAFSDASTREAIEKAHADYAAALTTAWQRDIDEPGCTADQPQRDATLTMDEVYAEYDRNLEQKYRSWR